jgi:hypothetical protein
MHFGLVMSGSDHVWFHLVVMVACITACSTLHIMLFIMLIGSCSIIVIFVIAIVVICLLIRCVIFVILTPLIVSVLLFVAVIAAAGWARGFFVKKLMILLELLVLSWLCVLHLMFVGCGV